MGVLGTQESSRIRNPERAKPKNRTERGALKSPRVEISAQSVSAYSTRRPVRHIIRFNVQNHSQINMITKVILCLALAAMAQAENWDLQESDVYGEARFVDGIFNNTSVDIKGALALLLIAILAGLVFINSGVLGSSRTGYDYNQYDQYYQQQPNSQFYRRSDQSVNDLASKLFELDQAFKKYEVTEAECEMYIACEASQVHRLDENGPLAKIVNKILSTFNRAKATEKWDQRVESLVQSFEYGTGAHEAGQVDPCQPLRNSCFELHATKA